MRLNAPKTMRLLLHILTAQEFSQRGLWSEYNKRGSIAIGQVNKVVRWLEGNAFVERRRKGYVLTNPTGLVRAMSLFRSMRELRAFSVSVDTSREEVLGMLPSEAILCLGTSVERYGSYFRSPETSFYAVDCEALEAEFSRLSEGLTKLSCYRIDFLEPDGPASDRSMVSFERQVDSLISRKIDGMRYTSPVQTVLDMFCDGKAHYTKELLKDLWEVDL
ncbi:MAG: hypothetical protein LN417_08075 [Candidatus Thermoplasmatota archaeon]|nr:hypothetical protein [Candidatus Thermoplasmatota archaeon]